VGMDFSLFYERIKKRPYQIRHANEYVKPVAETTNKISDRFASIEKVELDHPKLADDAPKPSLTLVKSDPDS
ncbi:MAG: hypothetical protein LH618_20640, partial [Saprospiraceae bacterium]|nr:hypothetical protein [Saprospiraceae bacterium]